MLIKGKAMKEIHLICNAHIDPIWQWEWEEGAAAAVSTFRSAADLADEFDYIFCHNEVTLYKYISEFAPTLFERIKELVRQGKWHVMGGWYLQPDCNMPCGESFVRQILVGQKYFYENFGVKPTTAVNFDSFGHSRGLVQIMKNCGQDSYIFCRSGNDPLPAKQFIWKGFDGSTIKAQHAQTYYSSLLGEAAKAIQDKANAQQEDTVCVLWGVGNHGGGPSRKDLADIKELIAESEDRIIHSTPEAFFAKIEPTAVHEKSLRTVMPGCYTSSSRIKRRHAELENTLWMTEKMCASAAMRGVAEYPEKEINEAVEDLLNSEFHDVLCGCTIRAGEENGLRILDHGLQNLNKIRAKAFFALSSAEPSAREGEFPILVFNPHPYELESEVSCEFMLADQNWKEDIRSSVHVTDSEEKEIPVQLIKEESNLNLDWRKRIVFNAKLKPLGITRFSVWIDYISQDNTNGFVAKAEPASGDIVFDCNGKHVEIDAKSGLIKSFRLNGREYIKGEAFRPILCRDNEDPWGMGEAQLKKIGTHPISFKLMKNPDGPFEGLAPIRIIEDGSVYIVSRKGKNTVTPLSDVSVDTRFDYLTAPFIIDASKVDCLSKTIADGVTTYQIGIKDEYTVAMQDKILEMVNSNNVEGVIKAENYFNNEFYNIKSSELIVTMRNGKIESITVETNVKYCPTDGEWVDSNVTLKNTLQLLVNSNLDKAKKVGLAMH